LDLVLDWRFYVYGILYLLVLVIGVIWWKDDDEKELFGLQIRIRTSYFVLSTSFLSHFQIKRETEKNKKRLGVLARFIFEGSSYDVCGRSEIWVHMRANAKWPKIEPLILACLIIWLNEFETDKNPASFCRYFNNDVSKQQKIQ